MPLSDSVHPSLILTNERYLRGKLKPGNLAAHRGGRLVLLPSGPDTVHRSLLRETRPSTLPRRGQPHRFGPGMDITPAVADCRYRAPLPPQLHEVVLVYPFFLRLSTFFFVLPRIPGLFPVLLQPAFQTAAKL